MKSFFDYLLQDSIHFWGITLFLVMIILAVGITAQLILASVHRIIYSIIRGIKKNSKP
ncbi:MAG: hypothetical protein ACK40G_13820 [Cytophagaceae bacterium]